MHSRKWPYALAAIIMGVCLLSLRPVHSLKNNPPESFLQVNVAKGTDAEAWGRAYWQVARNIQWKFRYGDALPDQPPVEFRVAEEQSVPPSLAAYLRSTYWYQLRTLWVTSEPWTTTYRLDFGWIPALIEGLLSNAVEWFSNLRHR